MYDSTVSIFIFFFFSLCYRMLVTTLQLLQNCFQLRTQTRPALLLQLAPSHHQVLSPYQNMTVNQHLKMPSSLAMQILARAQLNLEVSSVALQLCVHKVHVPRLWQLLRWVGELVCRLKRRLARPCNNRHWRAMLFHICCICQCTTIVPVCKNITQWKNAVQSYPGVTTF